MKATCWMGRNTVEVRDVPDPTILNDRDAIVLARVFGWRTDRIADQLGTTPAEIRTRLARGLRMLLPPRDCAGAASPAHAARAS